MTQASGIKNNPSTRSNQAKERFSCVEDGWRAGKFSAHGGTGDTASRDICNSSCDKFDLHAVGDGFVSSSFVPLHEKDNSAPSWLKDN